MRGWSAYYRTVVSSEVFTALDNHVWKLVCKWAKHSHPNKPKHWISDGTSWSRAGRPRTTWRWSRTGPCGVAKGHPRRSTA
ncbi:group II intron maturase-specific domain-containing protein [Streptomyces alanosinicus]|uniref:group II intron maturase-specific domain-containing protein n=1 Tax=Streptomyces alanosinicus TaxID=68171 RepID=UPI001E2AC687|nr:group II intron maturase-specific domain-containing protein [Streptomyces alanosinicus]